MLYICYRPNKEEKEEKRWGSGDWRNYIHKWRNKWKSYKRKKKKRKEKEISRWMKFFQHMQFKKVIF